MTHQFQRAQRVGDQIQKTLSNLLNHKTGDPRFKYVSITGVDLAPDMKNAIVFVSQLEEHSTDIVAVMKALNKAAGFFRSTLAKELDLRYTPTVRFVYDKTLKHGSELSQLINEVTKEQESDDA